MKIIYLHHANRNGILDDITRLGRKEAQIVAKMLSKKQKQTQKFTAIYSALSNRCKKTANIVNKKLQLPLIFDSRLDEYNFKSESWIDAQNRVKKFLDSIVEKYNNNSIIICITSGVNVCAFFDFVNNRIPSQQNKFIGVMSCSPLVFDVSKGK